MNFNHLIPDSEIEAAKARVWSKMQSKLHERELLEHSSVLNVLADSAESVFASRLLQVQAKERLMHMLPEREVAKKGFSMPWRYMALTTLASFFGFLFMPVFDKGPVAMADSNNRLEVAQGEVLLNGQHVQGTVVVQQGDLVETLEGSVAHLAFADDSRVTLAPGSRLELLEVHVDPNNQARTAVKLRQYEGEVWTQVLNLVDSEFVMHFPNGEVTVDGRASFNLEVGDETIVEVANNLVNISVVDTQVHRGLIGQGARMIISDGVRTESIGQEYRQDDMWWSFNLAYGKAHVRAVDERYTNERVQYAMILPGSPLYPLKTFREAVHETLALTEGARDELRVQHAKNRLQEAKTLIEEGDTEKAAEAMVAYQEKVDQVKEESKQVELQTELQESIETGQKHLMTKEVVEDEAEVLEEGIVEVAAPLTPSQKLSRVPELVEAGEFEKALKFLSEYSEASRSILVQLEDLPLEEREAALTLILERKQKDLQMLRVIAAMPELQGMVDIEAQVYKELSMMVVSLRERTLKHLDEFFAAQEENDEQQVVYERLKDAAEISEELGEQFEEVEAQLEAADEEAVADEPVVDIESEPLMQDPRFL